MHRSNGTSGRTPAKPRHRRLAQRLADEVFATYLSWRQESAAVETAYERWRRALAADRALTFAAYEAAVDLEETAAGVFCECAVRASGAV